MNRTISARNLALPMTVDKLFITIIKNMNLI